ncbi:hypothetical protein HUE87_02910 [Candidatus Sulfurimonas marisnigri]|uniref:Glycosyltransferase RgtA/B/C/D-like domain-containing protein n=1 Tax=Candidatus Sulfurimonas marisnigri TaxID=2740405 RepID=A0A7S7M142_9BACT|nr:hypothetical protein [Candidatus Sulfurimonas marisnigri]QOY55206.1 hypothetical protein HUE87_02910 [Candidatus Sulfurimonas marisnigri]
MNIRYILFLILGLDALILILQTVELSASYYEVSLLYGEYSFLQAIVKASIYLLGQNDFALRLPMIILHIFSTILLYKISEKYVKIQKNRIWLVLIFVLLPGVMSSAIIVNEAGLVLFGLFLFVYVYENYSQKFIYLLLSIYLLVSGGFIYLYLSLVAYSLYKKDNSFFIFNLLLFSLSLLLYGIDAHGSPRGHILDSIGLYAAIFTPVIFVYVFYVLYKRYLTKDIELLWFISSVAFVLSLLLSFRQRVNIEEFAPYLILALPLVAQTFEHSYRVRLKKFRKSYRLIFIVSLSLLFINSSAVLFNKYLYHLIEDPEKHFSYKMHVAKELAIELKNRGISCISTNIKMSQRLKFYGVTKCNNYKLEENAFDSINSSSVTISYKNRVVYSTFVTKINTN